jgi:tripartite ATP-independent transporter DctP family solute receptor
MTLDRRNFLRTVAALSTGAALGHTPPARAAEFSLKFASNLPADHPLNVRMKAAAEAIADESKGRVELLLFPNSQLGGDTDMLSQVRSGAIDFFTLSGLILATLVPVASINGIGFAFRDYGQVWAAMDGELGAFVRASIEKVGLHPFEKIWDNGYRQITTSSHPVASPDDLRGMKIRVPVSPLWTSMFKALEAAPTSINFTEVYSALQTHIVEAEENPLAVIQTAKLYEVQKYCSVSNHMWDGFWFLANRRSWERLPADIRQVIETQINRAALLQREDVARLNSSLQTELQARGMAFNSVDPQPFRQSLRKAGFYADWHTKYGDEAWKHLERYVGSLA